MADEEFKGGPGEGDMDTLYPIAHSFPQRTHRAQIPAEPYQPIVVFECNKITGLAYTHMV